MSQNNSQDASANPRPSSSDEPLLDANAAPQDPPANESSFSQSFRSSMTSPIAFLRNIASNYESLPYIIEHDLAKVRGDSSPILGSPRINAPSFSSQSACDLHNNSTLLISGRQYQDPQSADNMNNTRSLTSTPKILFKPENISARQTLSPGNISVGSSDSTMFCRICHEGGRIESLISPCYCAGTMGMMHRTCIEKWLESSNTTKCEICNFEFVTQRLNRSFCEWIHSSERIADHRNLVGDIVCFILLTPLAGVSAWLCSTGAKNFTNYDEDKGRWETVGLITLSVFLVFIYIVWCSIAVRYHTKVYLEWRSNNPIIKVMDMSYSANRNTSNACNMPGMVLQNMESRSHPSTRGAQPMISISSPQVSTQSRMVMSTGSNTMITVAMPVSHAANIVRNIPTASLSDSYILFTVPQNDKILKETYV